MSGPWGMTVVDKGASDAMRALAARIGNMQPALAGIGEDLVERTKRRFDTSTDPEGKAWKPNAESTLEGLAASLGKSFRKKDGTLNKKGEARKAAKKPLIGESGMLRQQIVAQADATSLTVSATPIYAAIHQFGGKAGRGHHVTIPARAFLPVREDGSLYPYDQAEVLVALNDYLMRGL